MRTEAGVVRYPVGDFSALRIFGEGGMPDRWDVRCFVYGPAYQEELAPDAEPVGRMLADQLEANGICSRPIWVGWHGAVRIGGEIRDA
jgi:hypothetical protein